MDPLSMMFMLAKAGAGAESGAPMAMLDPMAAAGQQAAPTGIAPMAAPTSTPGAGGMAGGMDKLGSIFSGVQGPKAPDPKFSGGVSGSGLPYVSRIEDSISPFLQATGAGRGMTPLPTLGALLSQAPGGGR